MLRHLLTMLALITGLAAAAAPVEARSLRANGAQVQLAGECVVAVRAQAHSSLEIAEIQQVIAEETANPMPFTMAACITPTVRQGVDRARE